MTAQPGGSGVRLAEAVAALSLAVDVGMGQPFEQGLRTCLLAIKLAEAAGLSETERRTVYYVALLRHVGCTAESDVMAQFLGDEVAFREDGMRMDSARPVAMAGYMLSHVGRGESPVRRGRRIVKMVTGGKGFMASASAVCESAQMLAARLGVGEDVQRGLWHAYERWNGKGIPTGARGDDIELSSRVVAIAEFAEAVARADGDEAAATAIHERSGVAFDPALVEVFVAHAPALLAALAVDSVWDPVLDAEPGPCVDLTDDELDRALEAVADFADTKSSFLLGHSRRVAAIGEAAAKAAGWPAREVAAVRRAGLIHDVGRVGVSALIWSKAGSLSRDDWEKVRLHPYYAERAFSRPAPLAELAGIGSMHHERVDGSGYHRAAPAGMLPRLARLLAAADVYAALGEERPYRGAYEPAETTTILRDEAKAGRLDGDAVEAVLAGAGLGPPRRRATNVAGLTDREVEVLNLVALGLSIKQIASSLGMAPKTADAHIQHIYAKTGVSTRAGATLFALDHGLVDQSKRREISR